MKSEDFFGKHNLTSFTSVLNRLIEMVKYRYGCDLKYKSLGDLEVGEKNLICSLHPKAPALNLVGKHLFPLSLKGEVIGVAELECKTPFNEKTLQALRCVMDLVIESLHLTACSLEVIETFENHLQGHPTVSKIISTRQGSQRDTVNSPWLVNFNDPQVKHNPCLIEGANGDDIHKMAIELHEHFRRYAFLSFYQLSQEVRTHHQQLHLLNNTTLFVPNITALSDEELFTLINFLKSERTPQSPQLIVGSTTRIRDLLDKELIPRELIRSLQSSFVRMQCSFEAYKKQGLLKSFLESADSIQQPVV